jgi:hypothetical protein
MGKVVINEDDIRLMVSEVINRVNTASTEEAEFEDVVKSTMTEIDKFLNNFGLRAKLLKSTYNDWVGQYRSRSSHTGVLKFSVSIPAIMKFREEIANDNDEFSYIDPDVEASLQVRLTLWHECGHGLVEFIKKKRRTDTQMGTRIFKGNFLKDTRWLMGFVEEDLVEEFGEYMIGERYESDLYDYLSKYKEYLQFVRQ